MTENECDVCGKHTSDLADYYANLCRECRAEHTDTTLLRVIGRLMNEKEGVTPEKRKPTQKR